MTKTQWTKTLWTTRLAAVVAAGVFGTIGCASSGSKIADDPMGAPVAKSATPAEATPTPPAPAAMLSLSGPVYFDTDRSALRLDTRKALRESAEKIQQHPEWGTLTIEGHCDERGSDEYNLALGERRAAKVRQYLKDLGVDGKRLDIVSYGETQPAARGHDESSWKLNRRSEIEADARHASTH
jgi:peptidoglycan-associated lipoprotein